MISRTIRYKCGLKAPRTSAFCGSYYSSVMTIAQVKEDLREGSAKFRELVDSIDVVRDSLTIPEAAVSS